MRYTSITSNLRWILQYSALLCFFLLSACSEKTPYISLEQLKSPENLRVGYIPTPGVFFPDSELELGMDYDLIQHFAETQKRKLVPVQVSNITQLESYLKEDKIDIALPGSGFHTKDKNILSSQSYRDTDWYIIYNQKKSRPHSLESKDTLAILANSNAENILKSLKAKQKGLEWQYNNANSIVALLKALQESKFDYTILDDDSFIYYRRLFPDLKRSFVLKEKQKNVWLCTNEELLNQINTFLSAKKTITLQKHLKKHYQQYLQVNDYIEKLYFLDRVDTRLEQYIPWFKLASKKSLIDWRLLAAISYQESHWKPNARSFTGVKGLMMLTQATAKQVGVEDRTDPKQSILGGAKYLNIVDRKIPDRILGHDRLWFTLAAYNVGYGHLEDARLLTQRNNGNPDNWTDVREYLKKLSKPEWYKKTKHGYARGSEPVYYVEHIRRYYITLKLYLYYKELLQSS